MSWLAALLMLLGPLFAYKLFGEWRNPGVLFATAWFVGCLMVALVGDVTYGVSIVAAVVFLCTVLLFNGGVLLGVSGRRYSGSINPPEWLRSSDLAVILSAGTLVAIILTPFYLSETVGVVGRDDIAMRLVERRVQDVELSGTTGAFSLLNNLPVLVQALVILAAFTLERRWAAWARLLALSLCWLMLGLSTASKLAAVQVPATVLLCVLMSRNKIPLLGLVIGVLSSLGVFTLGLVMINFGYLVPTGATFDLAGMAELIASYFLGGLVGFSELLAQGLYAYWPQNTLRSVLYTVNAFSGAMGFGDVVSIGYQHAPYIVLGPGLDGNVYTAIFSYYATGEWLGVMLWPVVAGLLCGWAYRGFYAGRTWALVAVPVLFYGVLASVYSEQIFGAFLITLKLLLVIGGIQIAVEQAQRFRAAFLRQAVS